MEKLVIEGGKRLTGRVSASGSKNAALPILAACLLAEGTSVIRNVPSLSDVEILLSILRELGCRVDRRPDGAIEIEVRDESNSRASYELVSRMRASVCVLGPLVGRRKTARVPIPGGCVIGVRPIDLHEKGLQQLGARMSLDRGDLVAEVPPSGLTGAEIFLGGPFGSSVTGTANVMMAAVYANGTTVIESAACEPEVVDLADLLVRMGARIEGIGSPRLTIHGVKTLRGAEHTIIPDRIEAGTFLAAAAITRGDVTVDGARGDHLRAAIHVLRETGMRVELGKNSVRAAHPDHPLRPVDLTTLPYPGFPTDLQAQFMAALCVADGISVVTEKIYPDRFMHVSELLRMGAELRKSGATVVVHGVPHIVGAPVRASDLRASAALVIAGCAAWGETEIRDIHHIDRGYERIEEKLNGLGAGIRRVNDASKPDPRPGAS
ncbi:MAG: UDP-N-acetylglucosamine 1-carboxyvinyltransferase [Planctomycetes bacterium]|nr:UDP-N-acetylglucosamine 1-carboxyvinyltransferase [Planctomycetota bacterium]